MSSPTPVTPRPAAAVILVREGESGLEVLMLRKSTQVSFAAGALVFPGGRVDAEDHEHTEVTGNDPLDPFKVAAIRELQEEAGVTFEGKLADLIHFAHWITPEASPKRFDTHFFMAAFHNEDHDLVVDGGEITQAQWYRAQDLITQSENGEQKLVLATLMNLTKIATLSSLQDLASLRDKTVITVQPEQISTDDGTFMKIPMAAGYGVDLVPVNQTRKAYKPIS